MDNYVCLWIHKQGIKHAKKLVNAKFGVVFSLGEEEDGIVKKHGF
jgi:hypothetical protein